VKKQKNSQEIFYVPKMKTKKAVAARFKVTASGKLKFSHPGKRHLMTGKAPKRKRQLNKRATISEALSQTYKRLMCVD
jgi:large subunit ribosomal protein L35